MIINPFSFLRFYFIFMLFFCFSLFWLYLLMISVVWLCVLVSFLYNPKANHTVIVSLSGNFKQYAIGIIFDCFSIEQFCVSWYNHLVAVRQITSLLLLLWKGIGWCQRRLLPLSMCMWLNKRKKGIK